MSSKSSTPTDDRQDGLDEETRESLEDATERYEGELVGAVAEMLLHPSEESHE